MALLELSGGVDLLPEPRHGFSIVDQGSCWVGTLSRQGLRSSESLARVWEELPLCLSNQGTGGSRSAASPWPRGQLSSFSACPPLCAASRRDENKSSRGRAGRPLRSTSPVPSASRGGK